METDAAGAVTKMPPPPPENNIPLRNWPLDAQENLFALCTEVESTPNNNNMEEMKNVSSQRIIFNC